MDVLLWIGRLKLVKLRSMVGFRFHSEAKLLDHNTNTTTYRSSIWVFSVLLSGFGCSSSRITRSLENCDHLIEWFWGTVALGKYWVQSSKHSPESMFSLIYLFFFFFLLNAYVFSPFLEVLDFPITNIQKMILIVGGPIQTVTRRSWKDYYLTLLMFLR